MATELDHGYCGWPHEELLIQEDSQDAAIPQMLDHGSVSFGRYGVESLAWEKRSAFIHDGRKEELEKLKSPGLVAEKKAFFEEYYKRIRAMKALQVSDQAEPTMDSGGDDNVGYRNDAVGDKSLNVGVCSDEHDTNVPTEAESANTFNGRQSDPKSFLTCSNSSAVDVEAEVSAHLCNLTILEVAQASSISSTKEEIEIDRNKNSTESIQHGHIDLEPSVPYEYQQKTELMDEEPEMKCINDIHVGYLPTISSVLDSRIRMDGIESDQTIWRDDTKKDVGETHDAQSSIGRLDGPDYSKMESSAPEHPSIEKDNISSCKRMENPSTTVIMESASSVWQSAKMECGENSEAVMESKGPRRLPKKFVLGEENPCRRKAASCRFTRKNKSSSGSLRTSQSLHSSFSVGKVKKDAFLLNKDPCNRLPTDKRSGKGTSDIPLGKSTSEARSFRFATQRRPTTSDGIRESGAQHPFKPLKSSPMKTHVASDAKPGSFRKKSHQGEASQATSKGHTSLSGTRARILQTPDNRSLPAVGKCRPGFGVNGERPTKVLQTRPRSTEGAPKHGDPPLTRASRSDHQMQVSSRAADGQLYGKKPRREVKPWR